MTRMRFWLLASVIGPAFVAACNAGTSGTEPDNDGGLDATSDGPDGSEDGMADARVDGVADGAKDTGPEASPDAGPDSADAGPVDSGHEASPDGASDAAAEAEAGPPQPIVLASNAPNATQLATDGTSVFWIDTVAGDAGAGGPDSGIDGGGSIGRVMKIPAAGGSEVTLASTPGAIPQRLAIDATNVYWIDSAGALRQVPKDGSSAASVLVAANANANVATGEGEVYYGASPNGVSRVGLDGGAPQSLATSVSPLDFVVLAGNVYWATAAGTIQYVSASAGGSPSTLVSPDPDAGTGEFVSSTTLQNLTTDGTSLYWNRSPAGPYPGAVMAASVLGGAPQVVTNTTTLAPFSVATDGTNVYYLLSSPALMKVPSGGGTPIVLTATDVGAATHISGAPGPTVAVDGTNVYWLNPPQIVKIAK